MKKKQVISFLLCLIMLLFSAGCNEEENQTVERNVGSTVISTSKNVGAIDDAKEVVYAYLGKLRGFDTYEMNGSGKVNAKKGIISYQQKLTDKTVKNGDEYYFSQNSKSTLMTTSHQAFFKNGTAVYGDDYKIEKEEDYVIEYGLTPNTPTLAGYIVNDDSIISAEKIGYDQGVFTFKYVLDVEKSTPLMKVQMKTFGDLKGYPEFKGITVTLKLHDDWVPESFTVNAEYSVSIFIGAMDCKQELTCAFTNVNKTVSIPNVSEYRSKLQR